jgi:REP element-mobilizing transposase RayT
MGYIDHGDMHLNDAGKMVTRWWTELNQKFPIIEIDQFIITPNHFHGIIIIKDIPVGADLRVGPNPDLLLGPNPDLLLGPGADTQVRPYPRPGVPAIVQWFKTMTTNAYIRGVKQFGWEPFQGTLWQRNYYDHILRDEKDLDRVRKYILLNPMNWEKDQEYEPHAG